MKIKSEVGLYRWNVSLHSPFSLYISMIETRILDYVFKIILTSKQSLDITRTLPLHQALEMHKPLSI